MNDSTSLYLPPLIVDDARLMSVQWNLISPCSPPASPLSEQASTPPFEDVDSNDNDGDNCEECSMSIVSSPKLTVDEVEYEPEPVASASEHDIKLPVLPVPVEAANEVGPFVENDFPGGNDLDGFASSPTTDDGADFASVDEIERPSTVRASLVATWSTSKARTYAGAASSKMHAAYTKLRSRSRSLSQASTLRCDSLSDDDGDFSSDDEDYSGDQRRSSMYPSDAASTGTNGGANRSLPARLSKFKVNGLLRFRHNSVSAMNVQTTEACSLDEGSGNQQEQLKALKEKAGSCATKAALLLNAASVQASRKIQAAKAYRRQHSKSPRESEDVTDNAS